MDYKYLSPVRWQEAMKEDANLHAAGYRLQPCMDTRLERMNIVNMQALMGQSA